MIQIHKTNPLSFRAAGVSLLLSLEKKILSLRLQPCAQHMAFSSHYIPMFPTQCFLCKPCTLPTGEVAVSDTKWCVSWTCGLAVLTFTVPSQSRLSRSCLSQFAEMLTLHMGAFEDVSLPFLSPLACGR